MSEERGRRDGKRERERSRDWNGKQGARARGTGGREGEMIARNSSPGRCGVEGIIQTLPSLSPLLHLSKRVGVCAREGERGACGSSERSGEEAEAPLIFSLCRAHRCSQTSGLTLITHIYRQGGGGGGGEGAERFDL